MLILLYFLIVLQSAGFLYSVLPIIKTEVDTTHQIDKIQRYTEKNPKNSWMAHLSSSVSGSHSAVYHYQFRIQFVNQMERIQPSLTISLSGTKEESGDLPITVWVRYRLPSGLLRFTSIYSMFSVLTVWNIQYAAGLSTLKKRKQVGKTSWHTWKQLKLLHEREL